MQKAKKILDEIKSIADDMREIKLMEVCGTHTQTIAMNGIKEALPDNIKLISGPGCPVCVTSQRDIDIAIELVLNGVKIATYGDMVRVPGSRMRLDEARKDKNIKVLYSVDEIIGTDYVFLGTGFETTAPMTAYALENNVPVLSVHKLIIPALNAIIKSNEIDIDGFINPGHVSVIIGSMAYDVVEAPQVISGFERDDVLMSVLMLLKQIKNGEARVENQYSRAVSPEGNTEAMALIKKHMEPYDAEWRGFGVIPESGLKPKNPKLDAREIFSDIIENMPEPSFPKGCICNRIVKGLSETKDCPVFREGKCTPHEPVGPCMVSIEGVCNVYYRNKKE